MAFNAYLYFTQPSNGIYPKGESGPGSPAGYPGAIQLSSDWGFSLENKLNIGPHTSGIGAGKAEFLEFTAKKQVDKASPLLMQACGRGCTFNNVELLLTKSTGNGTGAGELYLRWTYQMFGIQKVEWSNGEEAPDETITFRFGVMTMMYFQQSASDGTLTLSAEATWNQINNNTSPVVTSV